MKKNFPVIVEQDEDGVFIVECPSLKGCRSYGYTIEEVMENIRDIRGYVTKTGKSDIDS